MHRCYTSDFISNFWQCGQFTREAVFGFPVDIDFLSIVFNLVFVLVLTIIVKIILFNGYFSYLFQVNYNDPNLPSKDVLAKITEYKQIRYQILGYTVLITIIAYLLKWTILRVFIPGELYPYLASVLVVILETIFLSLMFGKYLKWYGWLILITGHYLLILLVSFLPYHRWWRVYAPGGSMYYP